MAAPSQPSAKPALKMAPKVEPKDPFEEAKDKKAKKDQRRNEMLKKVSFDAKGHPVITTPDGKPIMGIPQKAFYMNQPEKPKESKDATDEDKKEAERRWRMREVWRNAARAQVLQYLVYKAQARLDAFLSLNDPKAKLAAKKAKMEAELARINAELEGE